MRLTPEDARRRATSADHAVLATIGGDGRPDLVPVCFAIEDDWLATPIERVKPKASTDLERVANLARDARATLLVEHWDRADWSRLWWVRLRLEATTLPPEALARLEASLRDRYPQYREAALEALLTFRIVGLGGWAADAPT